MLITSRRGRQGGQVMVLVAVALMALIGSAALVLLAGSVEWQKNQLQELADSAALDSALVIGIGCDAVKARAVITEADAFLGTRRTRTGGLAIAAGTCATPYRGTRNFSGGLTATINYPYRAHQQQVEVILTLALPIAFGGEVGARNTTVVRRAVAQGLAGSMPAVSATNLTCVTGQVNVNGSVMTQNRIVRNAGCVLFAHARLTSGAYSDLGNVGDYADGQVWRAAAGRCAPANNAICADGYELSGHTAPTCPVGGPATSFLSPGDAAVNPNPCAAGTGPQPVPPLSTNLPPEPNLDPKIYTRVAAVPGLPGNVPCNPGAVYPNIQLPNPPGAPVTVGTGLATGVRAPILIAGVYHFQPSCYGYLNIRRMPARPDTLPRLAVLDPGFYYFNGSGSPRGGGGICLNDTAPPPGPATPLPARNVTLLARDVTLEFVNQTGFSSGTCVVGGGPNCTAPCQFGSEPCSLRACPPNVPPLGVSRTWFAAPCAFALPAPDTASCTPSVWCTAGDRACSNLLIWAAPAIGGQFGIRGPAAQAWLLGTIYWPGTCSDQVNGTSRIAGSIACGNLSIQAAAGTLVAGSDYGVSTALVEAVLVE
jgi:hypothetical protein